MDGIDLAREVKMRWPRQARMSALGRSGVPIALPP
jgi:hypothetical protein